jgi:large subunit ribosomal protein L11
MLRKAAAVPKGSASQLLNKIGSVTRAQIRQIAETKMPDLNTRDINKAIQQIEGTAHSMGIEVK